MANGESRDTTLRDARKHGYVPSVTGIIDILDKPGINIWSKKQVLLSALTLPKIEDETIDQFSERVMTDAFKEANDARETGTEVHDSIETIWNDEIPLLHYEIADKTVQAIVAYCDTEDFNPEVTVVGNGYGGKVDLHNNDFLIDYKGKDIKDEEWNKYRAWRDGEAKTPPRLAYPEHCMQLAAYDCAMGTVGGYAIPSRRLLNVFFDRVIPGRVIIHEWTEEEADIAAKKFMLLVRFWQLERNYNPEEFSHE